MEVTPAEMMPLENVVKKSVEDLIQPYTELKCIFFENAFRENDEEANKLAGSSYGELLRVLIMLIELSKPDNSESIDELVVIQKRLYYLNGLHEEIDDNIIQELLNLVSLLDTTYFKNHLKTQPTIARCISHTRSPLINIDYNAPESP